MAASSIAFTSLDRHKTMSSLASPSTPTRNRSPLPGFGLSLGLGMAWLGVVVLLPLAALAVRAAGLGPQGWLRALRDERVHEALKLSLSRGCWCATASRAGACSMLWSTCLSRCRPPSLASR
jgi:sulfate transport system permease protein